MRVLFVLAGAVVLGGAALSALPVIWRMIKGAASVPKMLDDIVAEFKPNSGTTLKDSLNRVETRQTDIQEILDARAPAFARIEGDLLTLKSALELNHVALEKAADTQAAVKRAIDVHQVRDDQFEEYVHARHHDIMGMLSTMQMYSNLHPALQEHVISTIAKEHGVEEEMNE